MCSQPLPTDKRYLERLHVAFARQKGQGMDVTVSNSRDPVSSWGFVLVEFGVSRENSSAAAAPSAMLSHAVGARVAWRVSPDDSVRLFFLDGFRERPCGLSARVLFRLVLMGEREASGRSDRSTRSDFECGIGIGIGTGIVSPVGGIVCCLLFRGTARGTVARTPTAPDLCRVCFVEEQVAAALPTQEARPSPSNRIVDSSPSFFEGNIVRSKQASGLRPFSQPEPTSTGAPCLIFVGS